MTGAITFTFNISRNISKTLTEQGLNFLGRSLVYATNSAAQLLPIPTVEIINRDIETGEIIENAFPLDNVIGPYIPYFIGAGVATGVGVGLYRLHQYLFPPAFLEISEDDYTNQILEFYNTNIIPMNESFANNLLRLFIASPAAMLSFNSSFTQLIAMMIFSCNSANKEVAKELYNKYISDERVTKYTLKDEFGAYGEHKVDWTDEHAANFILLSSDPCGPVMLLSQNSLELMLRPEPGHSAWKNFYLYNSRGEPLSFSELSHEELFHLHFPIFKNNFYEATSNLPKLLNVIMGQQPELLGKFLEATKKTHSTFKFVEPRAQQKLKNIFTPLLEYKISSGTYYLTKEHFDNIINEFSLSNSSVTDQARILLCLCAVFTKFSSSALFGTEHNSPETLRFYAHALMEKAYTLDPKIFLNVGRDVFADWKNHQLGIESAFSCSAVLSETMVKHIKNFFPDVLASVMPPVWN